MVTFTKTRYDGVTTTGTTEMDQHIARIFGFLFPRQETITAQRAAELIAKNCSTKNQKTKAVVEYLQTVSL